MTIEHPIDEMKRMKILDKMDEKTIKDLCQMHTRVYMVLIEINDLIGESCILYNLIENWLVYPAI